MKSKLLLIALGAMALFAGSAAMADSASPPGLTPMTSANAKNATKAELLAVTLPDKRHGTDAIARFKEPQYSSVVGSNAGAAKTPANFMGEMKTEPLAIAGAGSGHGSFQYSIAGADHLT